MPSPQPNFLPFSGVEICFMLLVSLSISVFIKILFTLLTKPSSYYKLPPGPPAIPIIGSGYLLLLKSLSEIESILRNLHAKYGPVFTLRLGSKPAIYVANRFLAHQALIQNGAIFADRPPVLPVDKLIASNQHNISNAPYGPTWRLLRRNLASEILHPSRMKSFSHARKRALEILVDRLKSHSKPGAPVCVIDHLHYAMFCLLALMTFGDKLEEKKIREIEQVQQNFLSGFERFQVLNFWPRLGKILFRKRWEELFQMLQDKDNVFIPLINTRKKIKQERLNLSNDDEDTDCDNLAPYVDSLLDLQLPKENNRKLNEHEIIAICSEFLDAGTDTTSTALHWILANLVKYPEIQERLYMEMKGTLDEANKEVTEEDLFKLPYLKAVVLEGLRRHPPGHFTVPHAVTEDVVLDGSLVPKNVVVHFMVTEINWDPQVWEDPMAFKPERFLISGREDEVFDITGTKEIKMMTFGAGRRMCPGYTLAILHLEYFVANLVWLFKWEAMQDDDIDLTEKPEFTIAMKTPLQAHLLPRMRTE